MDETVLNFSILYRKYAGHLKAIAQLRAYAMTGHYAGGKAANPGGKAEKLSEIALYQPEGCIKFTLRVTYMNGAIQVITIKIPFRNVVGGHMNKDDLRALFFDTGALFGYISQGFPAESASEVAQKDQKHRLPKGIIKKCLTGI